MDIRALALDFISSTFVKQHRFSIIKLAQSYKLKLVNDTLASMITHYFQVYFRLGHYYDEILYFITNLGQFDLIFGTPWLEQLDPKLSFYK